MTTFDVICLLPSAVICLAAIVLWVQDRIIAHRVRRAVIPVLFRSSHVGLMPQTMTDLHNGGVIAEWRAAGRAVPGGRDDTEGRG